VTSQKAFLRRLAVDFLRRARAPFDAEAELSANQGCPHYKSGPGTGSAPIPCGLAPRKRDFEVVLPGGFFYDFDEHFGRRNGRVRHQIFSRVEPPVRRNFYGQRA
jgi:hypothetical protein